MNYREKISSDYNVMLGKPVIKGTRITVEIVLQKLSEGMSIDELLTAYPHLEKDDIMACLSYSADILSREEIIA